MSGDTASKVEVICKVNFRFADIRLVYAILCNFLFCQKLINGSFHARRVTKLVETYISLFNEMRVTEM